MVYENILLRFFLGLVFSIFKALFIQLSFLIVFGISYPHSIKKPRYKNFNWLPQRPKEISTTDSLLEFKGS